MVPETCYALSKMGCPHQGRCGKTTLRKNGFWPSHRWQDLLPQVPSFSPCLRSSPPRPPRTHFSPSLVISLQCHAGHEASSLNLPQWLPSPLSKFHPLWQARPFKFRPLRLSPPPLPPLPASRSPQLARECLQISACPVCPRLCSTQGSPLLCSPMAIVF